MYASKAPYTQLCPFRGITHTLVYPISEYRADGSRYVELWITPEISPHLAHQLACDHAPVELEPFPGGGHYKGKFAVNFEDILQELTITNESHSKSETLYIHMRRHADEVRVGEGGLGSIYATLYEETVSSEISARIEVGAAGGVQLFGNNMPCTALVIQLNVGQDLGLDPWAQSNLPIHELYESVEETNNSLGLTGCRRVHTGKRAHIIGSDGSFVYGPGNERLSGLHVSLSLTHKRTPKRWENTSANPKNELTMVVNQGKFAGNEACEDDVFGEWRTTIAVKWDSEMNKFETPPRLRWPGLDLASACSDVRS
ncbi:hypothetical protein B0J17DRAFT_632066 [Rhizoctonia solani]|nr:hypothetical protein B0J17DRAFT_632066 [Rhizoctonia solani]